MSKTHEYYTYILSNSRGTLYTGVTSNLIRRIAQHHDRAGGKFTRKYRIHRLIYFEKTHDVISAIEREKQIKSWSRKKKLDLIRALNPKFEDLTDSLF